MNVSPNVFCTLWMSQKRLFYVMDVFCTLLYKKFISLRIGHDNKGGFAGWYLDSVVIDAPSVGKKWIFPAGRWLDKGKDDGLLEVELHPSTDREEVYEKRELYTKYSSSKLIRYLLHRSLKINITYLF